MSRKTTAEYLGVTRRRYSEASPKEKTKILDEFVATTCYSRKHANKLLTGSRMFRERPGREKTYGEKSAKILEQIWRESGCMNTKYLKAKITDWVADYDPHRGDPRRREREDTENERIHNGQDTQGEKTKQLDGTALQQTVRTEQ